MDDDEKKKLVFITAPNAPTLTETPARSLVMPLFSLTRRKITLLFVKYAVPETFRG